MNRRDFLKGLITAAIAVGVAKFDNDVPLSVGKRKRHFVISNEVMQDPDEFAEELEYILNGEVAEKVEMGMVVDEYRNDYIDNTVTVVVTLV